MFEFGLILLVIGIFLIAGGLIVGATEAHNRKD